MKPGDLVQVIQPVIGNGQVPHAILIDEVGMIIRVHHIPCLKTRARVWYEVMMGDGAVMIPGWYLEPIETVGD